jgi:hypothetical protein
MATSVNLDIAQRLDITCRKGDTFTLTLNITDSAGTAIALTPYTFQMEVRDSATDDIIIPTTDFTFTKDADGTTGKLNITVAAADMTATGSYIYDLETTLTTDVQTWLFGVFTINDDVTA